MDRRTRRLWAKGWEGKPRPEQDAGTQLVLVGPDGFEHGEPMRRPSVFAHALHVLVAQLAEGLPEGLARMGQFPEIPLAAVGQVGVGVLLKADRARGFSLPNQIVRVPGVDEVEEVLLLKSRVILLKKGEHIGEGHFVVVREALREDALELQSLSHERLKGRMRAVREESIDLRRFLREPSGVAQVFQRVRQFDHEQGEIVKIKGRVLHEYLRV